MSMYTVTLTIHYNQTEAQRLARQVNQAVGIYKFCQAVWAVIFAYGSSQQQSTSGKVAKTQLSNLKVSAGMGLVEPHATAETHKFDADLQNINMGSWLGG